MALVDGVSTVTCQIDEHSRPWMRGGRHYLSLIRSNHNEGDEQGRDDAQACEEEGGCHGGLRFWHSGWGPRGQLLTRGSGILLLAPVVLPRPCGLFSDDLRGGFGDAADAVALVAGNVG